MRNEPWAATSTLHLPLSTDQLVEHPLNDIDEAAVELSRPLVAGRCRHRVAPFRVQIKRVDDGGVFTVNSEEQARPQVRRGHGDYLSVGRRDSLATKSEPTEVDSHGGMDEARSNCPLPSSGEAGQRCGFTDFGDVG